MTDWQGLYRSHVARIQEDTLRILSDLDLEGLVLGSGASAYYFQDDQTLPYRPAHHFVRWCPERREHGLLVLRRDEKAKLVLYVPDDYWHEVEELGSPFWAASFDLVIEKSPDAVWKHAQGLGPKTAYEGPDADRALEAGLRINVPTLVDRLNWSRSYKTPYEVECVREATRIAAMGHQAAKEAFFGGGSELDIHNAFLQGAEVTDEQLAYPTIVCLNEKGAILHYHRKRKDPRAGHTLLIDAGVSVHGYASDITRTYVSDKAPRVFSDIVSSLDSAQQKIAERATVGKTFADVHLDAHHQVAEILLATGVLKGTSAGEAVATGLTGTFFPHGFGHHLGILVHDVAGHQQDEIGTPFEKPDDPRFRYLRSFRSIEPGMLFTVEPGIYFIDLLLTALKKTDLAKFVEWSMVDELRPCGGVRIEDNIYVKEDRVENLTRDYLP